MIFIELFSLEPIGIGTELVESLTSYIARLAEEHFVTVGTLIGKEVAKVLGKDNIPRNRDGGIRLYDNGSALNGLGKQANDFSEALYKLTGQDLSSLTLKFWRGICPEKDLFRNHKAWCPICLEKWKTNHQSIYELLLWNFRAVRVCGNHNAYLNTICPLCGLKIPILSRKTRNGYCPFCGCWLGSVSYPTEKTESSWDHYIVSNIGWLLKNEMHIYFKDFIDKLIGDSGGLNAFSRRFNIPRSTASEWHSGLHQPSLYMILKLCFALEIDLSSINLNQSWSIKNELNNLYSKDKISRRKIDWENVKAILTGKINLSTGKAPSIREVATELNIDKNLLYHHFPTLCKEISKNYFSYIRSRKNERIENGRERIQEAIIAAQNIGENPSRRKLENVLPSSVSLREQAFKETWKELT